MKLARNLCLTTLLFCIAGSVSADGWGYEGETGPHHWHELFPEACSGRSQSPINIEKEKTLYDPNLREFAIWYDPPRPGSRMIAVNNGHTVQVSLEGDFFVSNAGLPAVYKSVQFHFHWGRADHHGSEHVVDGVASPIELHIVSYNSDQYDSIAQAVKEPQGLAVLGVMYEISDEDNEALQPFVDVLDQIKEPNANAPDIEPISLRKLLPDDNSRYYRYNGSLTTPGCFESVIWTVFEEKQRISISQLLKFRSVLQHRRRKGKQGKHHKRSLRLRRAEREAEKVLDELGIRGDEDQEAELKDEMETHAEHAKHEVVSDSEHPVLLDEAHHASTVPPNDHPDETDNTAADHGHHEAADKNEDLEEYIQEHIVDNFRPVQSLNDRLVYRSFKLSEPRIKYTEEEGEQPVVVEKSEGTMGSSVEQNSSAGQLTVSFFTLCFTGLTYFLFTSS